MVAHVLATRGLHRGELPGFQTASAIPGRVAANLRERTFDANVVAARGGVERPLHGRRRRLPAAPSASGACGSAAAWRPPVSAAVRAGTIFPPRPRFPPISIMNAEPPLPAGRTTARRLGRPPRPRARRAEPAPRRQSARETPPGSSRRRNPRRPCQMPLAPPGTIVQSALASPDKPPRRCLIRRHVFLRPDRQPRRDRLPDRAHREAARACAPSRSIREADADALHVRLCDEAHPIGPAPAPESYLAIDKLIEVARKAARRMHPSGLRLPLGERRISPKPAPRPASCSSGRRRRRSAPWGSRIAPRR